MNEEKKYKARFITVIYDDSSKYDGCIYDLEKNQVIYDLEGNEVAHLYKYAAWGNKGHYTGKDEVIDVSDELHVLRQKYGWHIPVYELHEGKARRIH